MLQSPRTPEEIKMANQGILNMLDSPNGLDQVSADATNAVREKIREEGWLRKIMYFKPTTPAESQRYTDRDGIYQLVDLTEDSTAATCNLVGELQPKYVKGRRVEVPMFVIKTEKYEKSEAELIAMDQFVITDLVRSLYYRIEQAEDARFKTLADKIITDFPLQRLGVTETTLIRPNLSRGLNLLVANELRANTILMHEYRKNEMLGWNSTDIGFQETTNIFYNGLSSDKIFKDVRWLASQKKFLNVKRVYYFAHEDYMGRAFEWRPVKVYVKKENGIVSFYAEEWIGFVVANTKAITCMDLA